MISNVISKNVRSTPLRYELGQDCAEPRDQIRRAEVPLVHWMQITPGRRTVEKLVLALASLRPGNLCLEVAGTRLLDAEPIVIQMFAFILDKANPVALFPCRDPIRLCQNACESQ